MTVESANYVNGLNKDYPPGSDNISEGDDHLRLIKDVLKKTFPGTDQAVNTIHVSATAPSVIVADSGSQLGTKGMIWYDTSTSLLKINTSSTGTATWITFGAGAPWDVASDVASQTGNSGKFLTTDGSSTSWSAPSSPAASSCFRAHRNGVSQTMSSTTAYQLLEFTHTDFDLGSEFVVEAGGSNQSRFVIPTGGAGKYYLHLSVIEGSGSGDDDVIAIYKNGSVESYLSAFAQYGSSYGSVVRTMQVSCIADASAADYFEAYYQTEHSNVAVGGTRSSTYFEGYKIV